MAIFLFGCTSEKDPEKKYLTQTQYDSSGNIIHEVMEEYDATRDEVQLDEYLWLYENTIYTDEDVIDGEITDVKSLMNEEMLETQIQQFTEDKVVLTINISYDEKNRVIQKEYLHIDDSNDYVIQQMYNEQMQVNRIEICHSNGNQYTYDLSYENDEMTKCLGYLNNKLVSKYGYSYK